MTSGDIREANVEVLLADAVYRHPGAVAVESQNGWAVQLAGRAERVVPAGVQLDLDATPAPTLHVSISAGFQDLRLTATQPSPEVAARHLAKHFREYPAIQLCAHGLPVWHQDRPELGDVPGIRRHDNGIRNGSCATGDGLRGAPALPIEHVINFINFVDALLEGFTAVRQRRAIPGRTLTDLLDWPLLDPGYRSLVRQEKQRPKGLRTVRARQLLTSSVDGLLRSTGTSTRMWWVKHKRPELVLASETSTGLHIAALTRAIGVDREQIDHLCAICGQPVTPARNPHPGQATYCRTAECQKERVRRNKARQRASTPPKGVT
jgi:hypothetical protein